MNKLTLLIGPSASGKSTFAKDYTEMYPDTICLCPDVMRKVLTGDMSCQSANNQVFDVLGKTCEYFMALEAEDIMIDATNLTKRNRRMWLSLASQNNYEVYGIIFTVDKDKCITRDSVRGRSVGKDVIERQFAQYEKPIIEEGFIKIVELKDGESWFNIASDKDVFNDIAAFQSRQK